MKQPTLFSDDTDAAELTLSRVGIAGSANELSKTQKQFNKAIAKIEAQMHEIEQWHEFLPSHHQRVIAEYEPLQMRLRESRIALVWLLDTHLDGKALTRTQQEKLQAFLAEMVDSLLEQEASAELIGFYDKYNECNYAEEQLRDIEIIRTLAADVFDVVLDVNAESPDQLMDHLHDQLHVREEERARRRKPRKKSEKAIAREAEQAAAAQNATRAVRDVYRKLASELHPDREPDPQRREQLTELMQQANHAYGEGDLLALLRLQLQIEQLDSQALEGLAEERLANYNRALREQSQRLQQELFDLTQPFLMFDINPRRLTPQALQHALTADLRDMEKILRDLERELITLQDVKQVKQWLKGFRRV